MLVGGLGTLLIDYFSKDLVIKYKKAEVVEIKDWIIDKFSCEQGEKLKITITNLDKNELKFQKGTDICTVYLEDGSWSKDLLNENSEITIPSYSSYSLFWDTRDVPKEGIYRVKPYGKDRPLRRSIFVRTKIKHQESPDDDG